MRVRRGLERSESGVVVVDWMVFVGVLVVEGVVVEVVEVGEVVVVVASGVVVDIGLELGRPRFL